MKKKIVVALGLLIPFFLLSAEETYGGMVDLEEGGKWSAAVPGRAPHMPGELKVSLVPKVTTNPPPMYWPRMRVWQGIPSVEVSNGGRLWATWYSGNLSEGNGRHFAILATSGDDGKTWRETAVFDPSSIQGSSSVDPCLWKDRNGKLNWIINFAVNSPRVKERGVWYVEAGDAEDENTRWKAPRLVANGVQLNKPVYLKDGRLLIPSDKFARDAARTRFYVSTDDAATSSFLSSWNEERVVFSEHMIVEKNDGVLLCLARGKEGILQAESKDGGKTWQTAGDFPLKVSVNTRFHFSRLKSGNLLLVANDHPRQRSNMTAFLSEDDGATWPHKLTIDERGAVSYPDAAQSGDGFIYIIYDRGRYLKGQQEILFAKITEADIKAGKLVSPGSKSKQLISNLEPHGGGVRSDWETSQISKAYKASLKK